MAPTTEEFTSLAHNLMAAKMYSLASVVMVLYDITLTFDDEVERIWQRRFTPLTILWCLNRWYTPLCYVVITVSFHQPWPEDVCHRYVLFPGLSKVLSSGAVGCVFILRAYAIFTCDKRIFAGGVMLLACLLTTKIWSNLDGTHLVLPEGLVGCILTGRTQGYRHAMTWVAELVFDAVMFFVTLSRVLHLHRMERGASRSLISLIHRDGIIYFGVIFGANLLTVLFYFLAPPDLKVINASFGTLITSLMVSRLILNLRGAMALDNTPVLPLMVFGQTSINPESLTTDSISMGAYPTQDHDQPLSSTSPDALMTAQEQTDQPIASGSRTHTRAHTRSRSHSHSRSRKPPNWSRHSSHWWDFSRS